MLKVKKLSCVTRCSMSAMAVALAIGTVTSPVLAQQSAAAPAEQAVETGIPAWGITDAELSAEPSVVYGVLDNGMRYAIKRNTQPAGEASMRFLFNVGTRDEADGEEGAAHFVEHMAFNGSTNIPEGQLVPMLERLGLAFGADTNAETGPSHTMYKLDLPKLDEETIGASMKILREMAGELTIAPTAVDAEKGIIVSEYQVRNTPDRRRAFQFMSDIMTTSRMADRLTAEPEATRSLTAQTLRGFYEGYYRPENATLVIVGDFDVADMEKRIADTFASWQGKGEARKAFVPQLAEFEGIKTSVFVDPGVREAIELHRLKAYAPDENTVEDFRGQLLDLIAVIAMGDRLSALSRAEDAQFLGGGIGAQALFQSAQLHLMSVLAKDGQWRATVQAAEQEWRRMAEFGVTKAELEQAKATLKASFETAAAQSNSRSSAGLASALALTSLDDAVWQSSVQRLALYSAMADSITTDAVKANFVAKWGMHPSYVQVASRTPVEGGADAVTAALNESAQVAVVAPEEATAVEFAYTDFGPAGQVVKDERNADLGIREVTFANGVRLNIKSTDFEPGKTLVTAKIGTGIAQLQSKPALPILAQVTNGGDDLGKHPAEEITRLTAGKQVGYGYSLDEGAVVLANSTTRNDLLFQLQLMTAQVTDTAFGAQAQRRWEGAVPLIANNVQATPDLVHALGREPLLTGSDPRFGFSDLDELAKVSMTDLQAFIGSQFASGRIDIGIVGDVEEDAAIAAVAQTLGALARPAVKQMAIPAVPSAMKPGVYTLYHKAAADQGVISLDWRTDGGLNQRDQVTRELLAAVIQLEALRILREELGATYTPNAESTASDVFKEYGRISVTLPSTPEGMDQVSQAVREIVAGFTTTAPTVDMMQRARQPILESYERQEGVNAGWIDWVVEAQNRPELLEERGKRSELLASITPEDVLAAAKQYLTGEPIEVRAVAAPAAAVAE